jgi:hypothetical protein
MEGGTELNTSQCIASALLLMYCTMQSLGSSRAWFIYQTGIWQVVRIYCIFKNTLVSFQVKASIPILIGQKAFKGVFSEK